MSSVVEHLVVGRLEAVPGVDQQVDPRQVGAALQERVDERGPGLDLGLRRRRVAVARHVDQHEVSRPGEEDQLLGAARRVRGAGQRVAAGERVDQARLADIGAADERDLDAAHLRQRRDRACRRQELPVGGEQPPAAFDLAAGEERRGALWSARGS